MFGNERYFLAWGFAVVLFLIGGSAPSVAQTVTLTGQVTSTDTEEPLVGANVFLDGTMNGAATDEDGRFRIEGVSPGSYRLVASMIGYQTKEREISLSGGGTRSFDFELEPNAVELEGITVEEDRSTWLDRLDRFKDHFFGDVRNADDCEILNPEVLRFQMEDGTLNAYATEPLQIENRTLGYKVDYHLRNFEADGERVEQELFGRFHEMWAPTPEQQRTWNQARERAYRGSFQHFIRALSEDTFEDEGFRVYTTYQRTYYYGSNPHRRIDGVSPVYDADKITQSSKDPNTLVLSFSSNLLRVEYVREQEPWDYRQAKLSSETREASNKQLSWVHLPRGRALVDLQSGQSFRSFAPVLYGYWGWAERVPNALPRGYPF